MAYPGVHLDLDLSVRYRFRFRVTEHAFDAANVTLAEAVRASAGAMPARCAFFVDDGLCRAQPTLLARIGEYCAAFAGILTPADGPVIVAGGENAKNDASLIDALMRAMHAARLCRQSYVIAVGGGAMLDVVGFCAATTHRGVRLIRLPSTTLAQCDSGVAVKNGVNAFGKKNFTGVFAPPAAVINDNTLLTSLSVADWRSGFSEIAKIGLIRDAALFDALERDLAGILAGDVRVAAPLITRSAEAHLRHIAEGGDPFEMGVGRPLDFGHWAAHRLESLSNYRLRHGEAVAIGIAIDTLYSREIGALSAPDAERVLNLLAGLGFAPYDPAMDDIDALLAGLDEFREHLGGPLTITLLRGIGEGFDAQDIDRRRMRGAISALQSERGAGRLCGSRT